MISTLVSLLTVFVVGIYAVFEVRYRIDYKEEITLLSQRYNVSPYLICATIYVESGWDSDTISSKGAVGLMQLMPSTAKYVADIYDIGCEDLTSPLTNIHLGIAYLSYLGKRFDTNWTIVAYNAGETIVSKWIDNGITLAEIPYPETAKYLLKINSAMRIYQRRYILQ